LFSEAIFIEQHGIPNSLKRNWRIQCNDRKEGIELVR